MGPAAVDNSLTNHVWEYELTGEHTENQIKGQNGQTEKSEIADGFQIYVTV
jgi:hypothetical protein